MVILHYANWEIFTMNGWWLNLLSARLVQLLKSKRRFFKKAQTSFAFGKLKTQLLYKSCVLNFEKKLKENAEWLMDPQGSINENAQSAFCIITVAIVKILKYPSPINFALFSSPLLCYRPTPVKKVSTKYKQSTTQQSPIYHHNPFQHLIIQTQNQQNQTNFTQFYKGTQ